MTSPQRLWSLFAVITTLGVTFSTGCDVDLATDVRAPGTWQLTIQERGKKDPATGKEVNHKVPSLPDLVVRIAPPKTNVCHPGCTCKIGAVGEWTEPQDGLFAEEDVHVGLTYEEKCDNGIRILCEIIEFSSADHGQAICYGKSFSEVVTDALENGPYAPFPAGYLVTLDRLSFD